MADRNIAELLAAEAEAIEEHRDDAVPLVRSGRPAREPSQVYSLRVPTDKLEQLRIQAAHQHVTPSALMRLWVLERLEHEAGQESLPQLVRKAVHEELVNAGLVKREAA